jgi:hypothetical protein
MPSPRRAPLCRWAPDVWRSWGHFPSVSHPATHPLHPSTYAVHGVRSHVSIDPRDCPYALCDAQMHASIRHSSRLRACQTLLDRSVCLQVRELESDRDEAAFVAREILALRKGRKAGTIAVLYRTHALARRVEETLVSKAAAQRQRWTVAE